MKKQALLSSSFQYRQQDPSFYGDPLDQKYSNGPVQQRKCTDVFCCLLMFALIGGMAFIGYLGFTKGQPKLLASPFDEDGNQCGVDQGYIQFDKIFISIKSDDPLDVSFVCVKTCPQTLNATLDCMPTSQVPNCSLLKIYQSKTIVNLCYPSEQVFQLFNFDQFMNLPLLEQYFADLKDGWPLIVMIVALSFIVSIIFTVFIRFCSGCFVWFTIIVFELLMLGIGTVSFLIPEVKFLQDIVDYNNLPQNLRDRNYQMACAIICWSLTLIFFLIACCFQKQIRVSIGILKASADFTRQQCYAFLIPVYTTILQTLYLTAWFITIVYIFSSAQKIQPVDHTPFGFVVFDTQMQLYTIIYVFGLLWIVFFLEAIGDYWTSSTVAIWYFQKGNPRSPFCRSIARSCKQFGSLAFGSLIVAIVVFIRMVLQYFTKLLKQKSLGIDQQVGPAKFALKCASCCIACFERIVRFLTRNAYIMMAISGKGFCQSAQQSFYLMVKSTAQFSISHGTTKIFIIMGKLMIIAICCTSGYLSIILIQYYKTRIYSPVLLTILFGIASYPIASAFLNLFQMASNTILMCYCLESSLLSGTNPRCPPGLKNFLNQYMDQSVGSQSYMK